MLLSLQQLRKTFSSGENGTAGVRDVSLDIAEGEGFSLLGPSGCGKTTTLRMIGGFETPESGKIFFQGCEITHLPPRKRDIRTVFQKYALFPHLDVKNNIAFGLRMKKVSGSQIKAEVENILSIIEISHLRDRKVQTLSGGEQQRVALARALVTRPKILLLDEPLSALDLKLRERMQLELLSLRKKLKMTFIFVTHDQTEAMALSDRIGVMNRGKLEQVGSPQEIYQQPKSKFVASFIGQANFFSIRQLPLVQGNVPEKLYLNGNQEWIVRPENMGLSVLPSSGAQLSIPVRAQESAFLGQHYLIRVIDATNNEYLVKGSENDFQSLAAKSELFLSWRIEDTWLVD